MKQLLIIGLTFPEPSTTAAGSRLMQLISIFLENQFKITFVSTAKPSEKAEILENLGISIGTITLNNSSFDEFIVALEPDLVLFDRYITEEKFGWRVSEACPNALKILDTQDLHFLRKAREEAVSQGNSIEEADLYSDIAKREIAGILRCDLTLIISEYEMELLQKKFSISNKILHYLPFLLDEVNTVQKAKFPSFGNRVGFISIGTFLHAPNTDMVIFLKREIWPRIKNQLPEAQLHIYGAYAPQKIMELHDERLGFLIKGWAESVLDVMENAKVCLAPLRFGAGLKGKLIDAMLYGTPAVTTTVGAEGLPGNLPFSGEVSDEVSEIVEAAVALYTDDTKWIESQKNGFRIINERFQTQFFSEVFINTIFKIKDNLSTHRNKNFIGQILQHHTLQSTKYFSKWIEAKNNR